MGSRLSAFQLCFTMLLAIVPAACGGGGGGGSSVLPAGPAGPPAGGPPSGGSSAPAAVAVMIAIPTGTTASSAVRRPRYISAGTKSIAIAYAGTRQSADCAATCAMTLQVTPGTVTFVASLYDAAGASGHVLATGQTTATIVGGQSNAVKLTFDGVPAKVVLSLAKSTVTAGTPATVPMTVAAQDAAGYTIVGPEPYANPIVLSNDDTSGVTALSTTSLNTPADSVALNYNGKTGIAAAHIAASVSGTSVSAPPVTLIVQSAPVATPPPTPTPTPAPPAGNVPAHVATWYWYGLNNVNASIPVSYMVAHADYVEDDGFSASHAEAFKDAGGKYAASYTDPSYVPYCHAPFTAPAGTCEGPVGNTIADESAWFHGADGGRVHHFVSNEFQYQEALNPASATARDAYRALTQKIVGAAPKMDFFFADDAGGAYVGWDGTLTSGWFYGYNAAAVEITTNEQFLPQIEKMLAGAARPVVVNGYDAGTRLPSYNGALLDAPNVAGDVYEGCYNKDGGVVNDTWDRWANESNGLLVIAAHHSKAICMSEGNPTPANRIYTMASWWMTYSEPYSIMAPLSPTPDGFTVLPEYDIVPRQPRATAASDVRVLRSSTGAYVREFAACYQAGAPIGPCATVVNPSTSGTVSMPQLSGSYAHALVVDDRSAYTGGTAQWTGTVPAQLGPASAVVLR